MIMDMLLAFSRGQKLDITKTYTKSEFIVRRGLNGDVKNNVLKIWARCANSPAPTSAGVTVEVWTGTLGGEWTKIGEAPLVSNLERGTTLAQIEVPRHPKYLLALVYRLEGTFTTAPEVDAGLVDGWDDDPEEKITIMGRYETTGSMEDIPSELAQIKAALAAGGELPPAGTPPEPEPEPDGGGSSGGGEGGGSSGGQGGGNQGT